MKFNLTCSRCGDNRFAFPVNGTDTSSVMCEECGHDCGTLGEIKARVEEAVLGSAAVATIVPVK